VSASDSSIRVVLDTNVLLRSLVNRASSSRQIVSACESRKLVILTSKPMIDEYRHVLMRLKEADDSISHFQIEALLRKLRYLGDYLRNVRATFAFPRDTTDAKMIELAIDGHATHLVWYDGDLLSLPTSRTDAGKRFRQRLRGVWVGKPEDLVRELGPAISQVDV
jgi:putative PIN family toxin of toxin-antitoxin system